MNFPSLKLLFILASTAFFSCRTEYVKSQYDIPSEKITKKSAAYQRGYKTVQSVYIKDTTIKDGRLSIEYKDNKLKKIGPLDSKGNPSGYWIVYGKRENEIEYVLHHRAGKVDSFCHPFSMINNSW